MPAIAGIELSRPTAKESIPSDAARASRTQHAEARGAATYFASANLSPRPVAAAITAKARTIRQTLPSPVAEAKPEGKASTNATLKTNPIDIYRVFCCLILAPQMAAHHRFVLAAPPGTVVPPYHAVFGKRDQANPRFRGKKPVLTLAGTQLVNNYHWDEVKRDLDRLSDDTRRDLSTDVAEMIKATRPASEIRTRICETIKKPPVLATRKDCGIYVEQDAIFLGISIGTQTPGHLRDHNLLEVHTVVGGCCRLHVESAANLSVGDAIGGGVPLFKERRRPFCYIVAGLSETDVLVSVNPHDIGT